MIRVPPQCKRSVRSVSDSTAQLSHGHVSPAHTHPPESGTVVVVVELGIVVLLDVAGLMLVVEAAPGTTQGENSDVLPAASRAVAVIAATGNDVVKEAEKAAKPLLSVSTSEMANHHWPSPAPDGSQAMLPNALMR